MGELRRRREPPAGTAGSRDMDATAVRDFFAPLQKWLDEQNEGKPTGWQAERWWVRVLPGEPNLNRWTSRHLIDFITGVSDVSSELAPFGSDPGMDSNSFV